MAEKWVMYAKRADFNGIGKALGLDPVVVRLMVNRNVPQDRMRRYLYGTEDDLYEPASMKDIVRGAGLIRKCIREGTAVAVATDFDVDGVMSGYILQEALRRLGAQVRVMTPDRITEGYGINPRIVDEAIAFGAGLIITSDNGIAAFEAIDYAKEKGLMVVVTDHHDIPYEVMPDGTERILTVAADAVINPKQEACAYPFKGLCGAGVVFKLVCLLYEMEGIDRSEAFAFLEYTAIATVADVMELVDENRLIVRLGLKRLAQTSNVGLRALITATGLKPDAISAYHIGFVLGPCFNAAGRLETAQEALALLSETDPETAARLAGTLADLNASRKEMTVRGSDAAVEIIESSDLLSDRILLVLLPDCHESLVGIIAGRIKERYHRPSIVFTRVKDGLIKGSGRSVDAYNMFEALNAFREMMIRFGGHPMAAGITMQEELLPVLRQKLNDACTLSEADLTPVVHIDMAMPAGYITADLIRQIGMLEPFGRGNPRPVFAQKRFLLISGRVLGKNQNVLRLYVEDDAGTRIEGVFFDDIPAFFEFLTQHYGPDAKNRLLHQTGGFGTDSGMTAAMTYYPQINSYMGRDRIQLVFTGYCRI